MYGVRNEGGIPEGRLTLTPSQSVRPFMSDESNVINGYLKTGAAFVGSVSITLYPDGSAVLDSTGYANPVSISLYGILILR